MHMAPVCAVAPRRWSTALILCDDPTLIGRDFRAIISSDKQMHVNNRGADTEKSKSAAREKSVLKSPATERRGYLIIP